MKIAEQWKAIRKKRVKAIIYPQEQNENKKVIN